MLFLNRTQSLRDGPDHSDSGTSVRRSTEEERKKLKKNEHQDERVTMGNTGDGMLVR